MTNENVKLTPQEKAKEVAAIEKRIRVLKKGLEQLEINTNKYEKKLHKNYTAITVNVPKTFGDVSAVLVFDDESMRCYSNALTCQAIKIKQTLLDKNYTGTKEWLSEMLHTNTKMMRSLDSIGE